MVIRQAQQDELRHGVFACFSRGDESVEFVQKFIGAKLVGISHFEIGKKRIEMAAQLHLRSNVFREHRDVPGIRAGAAARIPDIFFQRLALLYI